VHGVFVLVHGVFILVQEVFVLVQGVFVLVQRVFVLVHGVLGLRSSFLGLRFRNNVLTLDNTSSLVFVLAFFSKHEAKGEGWVYVHMPNNAKDRPKVLFGCLVKVSVICPFMIANQTFFICGVKHFWHQLSL